MFDVLCIAFTWDLAVRDVSRRLVFHDLETARRE